MLRRINEQGFDKKLKRFIHGGGVVVGVSAGSIIFANNLPDNLGLLHCSLDVHCSDGTCEKAGRYLQLRKEGIKLGNEQAIAFEADTIIVF